MALNSLNSLNKLNGLNSLGGAGSGSENLTPEELLMIAKSRGGAVGQVAEELVHPERSILSTIGSGFKKAFKGFVDTISLPSEIMAGIISPDYTIGEAIDQNKRVSDAIFGDKNLFGGDEPTTMQKIGNFIVRLPIDILTDPLTYLTFGASAGVLGLKSLPKISLGIKSIEAAGLTSKALKTGGVISKALSQEGADLLKFAKNIQRQMSGTMSAENLKTLVKAEEDLRSGLLKKGVSQETLDFTENELKDLLKATVEAPLQPDWAKKAVSNLLEHNPALTKTMLDEGGIKFFGKSILSGQRISSTMGMIPGMTLLDNFTQPMRNSVNALFDPAMVKAGNEFVRLPEEYVGFRQQLKDIGESLHVDAFRNMSNVQKQLNLNKDEWRLVMDAMSIRKMPADPRLAKAYETMLDLDASNLEMLRKAGVPIHNLENHTGLIFVPEDTRRVVKNSQFSKDVGAAQEAAHAKFIEQKGMTIEDNIPELSKYAEANPESEIGKALGKNIDQETASTIKSINVDGGVGTMHGLNPNKWGDYNHTFLKAKEFGGTGSFQDIGLEINGVEKLTTEKVLATYKKYGVEIDKFKYFTKTADGEATLAIRAKNEVSDEVMSKISTELEQEAIPQFVKKGGIDIPARTTPGFMKFSDSMDKLVESKSINPEDADILKTIFEGTDESFLSKVDFKANPRIRRAGNSNWGRKIEATIRKGAAGLSEKTTGTSKNWWNRADIEPSIILLHEYGHLAHKLVLNAEDRSIITNVFNDIGKDGRFKLFEEGMSTAKTATSNGSSYFVKNEQEFLVQSFAEYVFQNKVPVEKMRPLLQRLAQNFFDGLKRLVTRKEAPAMDRLKPIFEKMLRGDSYEPLSSFVSKQPKSFKNDIKNLLKEGKDLKTQTVETVAKKTVREAGVKSPQEIGFAIGRELDSKVKTIMKDGVTTLEEALKKPEIVKLQEMRDAVDKLLPNEQLVGKAEKLGLTKDEAGFFVAESGKIYKRVAASATELARAGFDNFDDNLLTAYTTRTLQNQRQAIGQHFMEGLIRNFSKKIGEAPKSWIPIDNSGLFQKGIDIGIPLVSKEGAEYVFHPAIAKAYETMLGGITKDEMSAGFWAGFDKIQRYWKASVTSIFPMFHGRNAISNVFLNMMDLGVDVFNPKTHIMSMDFIYKDRIANGLARKMIGTGDEAVKAGQEFTELMGKNMFTDKTGYTWTYGEIRKAIKDNNVAFTPNITGATDIGDKESLAKFFGLDQTKVQRNIQKFNPLNAQQNAIIAGGRQVGTAIEEQARLVNFISNLRKTGDVTHAAQRAKQFLFDYRNLTGFEKNVLRRLLPFYSFTKFNLKLQVDTLLHAPGRIGAELKMINSIAEVMGGEQLTDKEKSLLPSWMANSISLKRGDEIISGFGTPIEQPFQQFQPNSLLGSISPLFRYPVEAMTGYQFFRGKPTSEVIDAKNFRIAPQAIKDFIGYTEYKGTTKDGKTYNRSISLRPGNMNFINNLPWAGRVSTIMGTMTDQKVSEQAKTLSLITGVNARSADFQQLEKDQEELLRTQLEKVLTDSGVRGSFVRSYTRTNTNAVE